LAVLLRPLPATLTEVAFAVLHVRVADPGAVVVVGLALIEPETAGGAVTVTVWEIVADRSPAASIASAV
jgi:hypothetical protein